jgi:hypothetical protein
MKLNAKERAAPLFQAANVTVISIILSSHR